MTARLESVCPLYIPYTLAICRPLRRLPAPGAIMSKNRILKEALIDPNAIKYNMLGGTIILCVTIIGIPLLLIYIPAVRWYWTRYYSRLKVVLTTRELKVHRGIFIREEKSIPLEKITDLAVFEGPIMRHMGLKGIRIETAGQTSTAGRALVQIIGIVDTDTFRDMVLTQRDRITDSDQPPSIAATPAPPLPSASTKIAAPPLDSQAALAALEDIRDTLRRIEARIEAPARHSQNSTP